MRSSADADPPLRRRRRILIGAVAAAGLVAAGGLALMPLIRSPAEIAARAAPPSPSILTAPVEKRVLQRTVVLRGQVTGQVFEVTPTGATNAEPIVTGVRVQAGDSIRAGQVLIEVAGRPLVALPGKIPMYRDIRPGAEGDDVRQLQVALRTLGHPVGTDSPGRFGAGTKAALTSLYADLGYEPITVGEEEEKAAKDSAKAARRAADAARVALERARRSHALRDVIDDAALALRYAEEDRSTADTRLREAVATAGPILPWSEAVFLPTFPARLQELNVTVGAQVADPAVVLTSGQLTVHAALNPAERGLVRPGLPVEILSEESAQTVPGTLTTVGPATQDEQMGRSHPLVIQPSRPLEQDWAGQPVRVTIQAARTSGPVLVVPLSAISSRADGRTAVTRAGNGRNERVEVIVGMSGEGYAEVRPVAVTLAAGDRVIVGQ